MHTNRRFIFAPAILAGLMFSLGIPFAAIAQDKIIRMGNQKVGVFALLKASHMLEDRVKPLG
jgi:hypothetical protein